MKFFRPFLSRFPNLGTKFRLISNHACFCSLPVIKGHPCDPNQATQLVNCLMHYQWVWELSFTVLFILLSQRQSYLHWTSFRWTTLVDWPKLRSINEKHSKSLTELPKREGEGSIRTVIFLPQAPSPQFAFPPCEFFFCPCPPPSPPTLHFSVKEEAGNSCIPRSHFSKHERLQCWVHWGSCNNSKKNTLRGELIVKRKISRQERLLFEVS